MTAAAVSAASGTAAPPPRLPVELIDRVELRDGRSVVLRPVLPQDGGAAQAFVRALSSRSRYRRFHVGMPQLPQGLLERLVGVDQRRHVAIVAQPAAWPGDDDIGAIVAEARYVIDADGRSAEFAVVVADAWQGLGLGRRLLQALARHAARRGVHELHGSVLADNAPMMELMRSLGAELGSLPGERGLVQATFRSPSASPSACC